MAKLQLSAGLFERRCHQALARLVARGAANYQRQRHLPRLLTGEQINVGYCRSGTMHIVRALQRALRHERELGRAGHWQYDLNRHIGLRQALRAEMHHLRQQITGIAR